MDQAVARLPLRRAQAATTAIFFVHGAMLAAWAPHIASIKDHVGTSEAVLGWVLLCMAGGAMLAMQVVGRLIDRFGSRPAVLVSTILYCALVNGPLHAASVAELAVSLLLFGASAGAMDVAMNAHGATIEARRHRPCLSSMHGAFSVGALAGAFLGALMLDAGYAPWEHTLLLSVAGLTGGAAAALFLLPADTDRGGGGRRRRAPLSRTILVLGLLGAIAMMAEGTMVDWSAVYLRDVVGVEIAQEGWAFAGFSAAMATMRFAGDHLNRWVGRQRLLRLSAATALVGCMIMAGFPGLLTGVAGAVLVGIGAANCVPLVFVAAARLGGERSASGLAVVAGLSYCGFLLGPPMVGGLAELFSLRIAFAVIGALLLVLVFARLPERDQTR